jgi:hypothetical protein
MPSFGGFTSSRDLPVQQLRQYAEGCGGGETAPPVTPTQTLSRLFVFPSVAGQVPLVAGQVPSAAPPSLSCGGQSDRPREMMLRIKIFDFISQGQAPKAFGGVNPVKLICI